MRLLRALRVLQLARYSSAVDRFSEAFDDIKDELALFSGVTAVMTFIAAYGIWEFERNQRGLREPLRMYLLVGGFPDYGRRGIAPATVAGKNLAMLSVLIIGLGIVAVPSGLFASALSKTSNPRP